MHAFAYGVHEVLIFVRRNSNGKSSILVVVVGIVTAIVAGNGFKISFVLVHQVL